MIKDSKKVWKTPELEILSIDMTMASSHSGEFDEGFNGNHTTSPAPHHGS